MDNLIKKPKSQPSIKRKTTKGIEPIYTNVAGIDIGSQLIHVAILNERDEYEVHEFGAMTPDLEAIAQFLLKAKVKSAAMEATGVYWIPLFEILEDRGIKPYLVDPKSAKNVPGRKTDVLDCQWIHRLYSCGLLRPAFRPAKSKEAFRSYLRHRGNIIKARQKSILQMDKALLIMNIKLDIAVSDLTGETAFKIIRSIVKGERDPRTLAALRHKRCKKPEELFVSALSGNFQETHLFTLKQALETYDFHGNQLIECDKMLISELQKWEDVVPLTEKVKAKSNDQPIYAITKTTNPNGFNFDMGTILYHKIGVDLTAINALGDLTLATIISELGGREGIQQFETEKNWTSWLTLCPGNNVSGGKSHGGKARKSQNRIKRALLVATMSLCNSKCALGAFYRRMASRVGKAKAFKAVAHKLARLIYRLLTKGEAYVEVGQEQYEKKYKHRQLKNFFKTARDLGYDLEKRAI